jgi:hypothetical protein
MISFTVVAETQTQTQTETLKCRESTRALAKGSFCKNRRKSSAKSVRGLPGREMSSQLVSPDSKRTTQDQMLYGDISKNGRKPPDAEL